MIKTFTHRSNANAHRARLHPITPDSSATRRAPSYNPALELSSAEQETLNGAMLSLSEERIAQILALAGSNA